MAKFLMVVAPFYTDITDELIAGAKEVLEKGGHSWDTLEVPGSYEIPAAIERVDMSSHAYDGYIALGCVIKGETPHDEHINVAVFKGLMDLSLWGVAIGNGVLTVNSREQAEARAFRNKKNRGAEYAKAAIRMWQIGELYPRDTPPLPSNVTKLS